MIPSGIDPATFRLVDVALGHCLIMLALCVMQPVTRRKPNKPIPENGLSVSVRITLGCLIIITLEQSRFHLPLRLVTHETQRLSPMLQRYGTSEVNV